MALQPNKVPIQFRGLETKLDPKAAVVGDLTVLKNVRFDKPPSLQKRYGYELLAKLPKGRVLSSHKGQLLVGDGERLWSVDEEDGSVRDVGPLPICSVESSGAAQIFTEGADHLTSPCSATVGGIRFTAWQETGGFSFGGLTPPRVCLNAVDATTGRPVFRSPEYVYGTNPALVGVNGVLFLFYFRPASSWPAGSPEQPAVLCCSHFSVTDASRSSTGQLGHIDLSGAQTEVCTGQFDSYDLAVKGNKVYLAAREWVTGTPGVALFTFTQNADPLLYNDFALTVGPRKNGAFWTVALALDGAQGLWVAAGAASSGEPGVHLWHFDEDWQESTQSWTFDTSLDPDTTALALSPTLEGGVPVVWAVWGMAGKTGLGAVILGLASQRTGVLDMPFSLRAKPFRRGSSVFLVVNPPSVLQGTGILLSLTWDRGAPGDFNLTDQNVITVTTIATFATGVASSPRSDGVLHEAVRPLSTDAVEFTIPVVMGLDSARVNQGGVAAFTATKSVRRIVVDFSADCCALEAGDATLFGGGVLRAYDGKTISVLGFPQYPEIPMAAGVEVVPTASPSFVAAGAIGASEGAYSVCYTFEWVDANGVTHQSSPSKVVRVKNADDGTEKVALGAKFKHTLPPLLTYRDVYPYFSSGVRLVVWRTQADQSVFYRLPVGDDFFNSTGVGFEGFTDDYLAKQQELIFNPLNNLAEVPPLAPGPVSFLARYRNRLVLVSKEAPGVFYFSKVLTPGAPIEFNYQQFFQTVQGGVVPLNSAMEMDEKLILFAEDHVYWTAGDGPAPNGTGSDYSNPYRVPTEVGCASPRSLTLSSEGIFFQAPKGLYRLGRDLSLQYAGAPIENVLLRLKITSANTLMDSQRIVFTLANGTALAYDSLVGKWSLWANLRAADASSFGVRYVWVAPDGSVYRETPGAYSDVGTPVLREVATSVLSFAGISGAQRAWRLILRGTWYSPHKLLVSIAYDEEQVPSQVEEIDATVEPALYEYEIRFKKERSTAFQVTIHEQMDAPGEGFSLLSLALLLGVEPKLHLLPRSRSGTRSTVDRVTVHPAVVAVLGGGSYPFYAVVRGTLSPPQGVTWTASAGKINSRGYFTAPAALLDETQQVTVTATSKLDPSKSGTATVIVPARRAVISANTVVLDDGTQVVLDDGTAVISE